MKRLLLSAVLIAFFSSSTAYAEYYIAEPTCNEKVYCIACEKKHHRTHKKYHAVKHKKSSHHYTKRNSYNVTVTYYYPAVSCGCADVWVPGQCQCGRWVPAHWQSRGSYVSFEARPAPGSYSFGDTYYTHKYQPYTDDRATADDTDADMQVD